MGGNLTDFKIQYEVLPSRKQLDGLDVDDDEGGRAVEFGDQAEEHHAHGEIGLRSISPKTFSIVIKKLGTLEFVWHLNMIYKTV